MKKFMGVVIISCILCLGCEPQDTIQSTEAKAVDKAQNQMMIAQPIPIFGWSLERHLMIELYKIRNQRVATHSVWRSNTGIIEGDCPSIGFGLPYDVSLTNPLMTTDLDQNGIRTPQTLATIEQPEPNGIFASKNTSATWVMCVGDAGLVEPVYIETQVTSYPYPVTVDYDKNRVIKVGKSTVGISMK